MTIRDAAWSTPSVGMAAKTRARVVRVARCVGCRDRRAECLVRGDDASRAACHMAHVAPRLGEIELAVLPLRVDELRAVALVARREVAPARRIDPEDPMCRPRLAVLGYKASRPGIVSVT